MKGKSTEPCLKIINKVINLVVCFVPYLQNYYNVGRLLFLKKVKIWLSKLYFFFVFCLVVLKQPFPGENIFMSSDAYNTWCVRTIA